MKSLKEIYKLKQKIDNLKKQYTEEIKEAEKKGKLEETINGKTYKLIVSHYKQEIVNPHKLYEAYGKQIVDFITINIGKARRALGELAINAYIDDWTPKTSRKIQEINEGGK